METRNKGILVISIAVLLVISLIIVFIYLPRYTNPPNNISLNIPNLTIDASKPLSNRTINVSSYLSQELPSSQISISTNYTSHPWDSYISITGTNLTFDFPTNGYYNITINVTYQGININDEVTILLTSKNWWIWASGSEQATELGVYGTKGMSDPSNVPGARNSGASGTASNGNFWLFGGYGANNDTPSDYLNDLWMFDTNNLTWTWVSGNYSHNNYGTYGEKGIVLTENMPGARRSASSWTDEFGNFWLFGGLGYDNESGVPGYLNDLWRFNVTDLTWTWISGNYSSFNNGTYGLKGVADSMNVPGSRETACSSTDSNGNLWLFGGFGLDNESGSSGYLNDLWMFNTTDLNWTWISGNFSCNNKGSYGIKGTTETDNVPGSRRANALWFDQDDMLFLLGGYGYNNDSQGYLCDLWKFNKTNLNWTWISGNYSLDQKGIYGTKGVPSLTNLPGSRDGSYFWSDEEDNLWLFGGIGADNVSIPPHKLNDLWMLNATDLTWTWISGNYSHSNNGTYGTKNIADAANVPGARCTGNYWRDFVGNLWLFGGTGYDNGTTMAKELNDLWEFII